MENICGLDSEPLDTAGAAIEHLRTSLGFEQRVDQGTRISNGSAPTLLDLVLTDRPELVRDVPVLPLWEKGITVLLSFQC